MAGANTIVDKVLLVAIDFILNKKTEILGKQGPVLTVMCGEAAEALERDGERHLVGKRITEPTCVPDVESEGVWYVFIQ